MRDKAAVARVVGAVGGDEAVGFVWGAVVECHVFGHGEVAMAVAVDVFPGVGVGEGELIWSYADYIAVGVVEFLASVGELPGEMIVDEGKPCCSVGYGTWVRCEGVEIDVI